MIDKLPTITFLSFFEQTEHKLDFTVSFKVIFIHNILQMEKFPAKLTSICSIHVKSLELNLGFFYQTRKIFEAPTMPAPFLDGKRSKNNGTNLTTGLLRVPSRVLIRADLTTPSFQGYVSTIRAILYLDSFYIVFNQPNQISDFNICFRLVPLRSDIVLWKIFSNPPLPNHVCICLARSKHLAMV